MFSTVEKGRYLTLYGADVPKYKARTKLGAAYYKAAAYVKRPEVSVPLVTLFGLANYSDFTSMDIVKVATMMAVLIACSDGVVKGASILHGKDKALYIDTHEKKSATKAEEMHFAKTLAKAMGAMSVLALGSVAYDSLMGSNVTVEFFKQSKPSQDLITRLLIAPTIILNANRFINIVRGKSNLVDEPPVQQQRELKASLALS